jgi:uncharacterized membrane-anchored protein YjiN (DUF445 family)
VTAADFILLGLVLLFLGTTAVATIAAAFWRGRAEGFQNQGAQVAHDRDEWRKLAAELISKLTTLRREGFIPGRAGKVIESKDLEAEGLKRAEDMGRQSEIHRRKHAERTFLENAVADIEKKRPGITRADALKEARKLYQATIDDETPT